MALKEFIVAIELGSSKIRGIAGKKNVDGSIQVLSLVEEDATACIRKGMVYNIDKTSLCLQNIIKKLKQNIKTDIAQVYVGVGGQSVLSVRNVIVKQLPNEEIITTDMINEIMDNNRSMTYPDKEILDAVTLEYKVGTQHQIDPVGVSAKSIEGNFLNILQRKALYNNLNKCFERAGISIAEVYLAPIALADSVLTETEKRLGCVLVDLGADTTTMAVYYRNILRHLVVLPLGGSNVTKDLTVLKMEESEAEKMKLKYACAHTEPEENGDETKEETYTIEGDRKVSAEDFNNIVEDRMFEIIKNAWSQVPEGIVGKVSSGGIILTGGGSNMKNIKQAFTHATNVTKIRIASKTTLTINTDIRELAANNGTYNTLLGLLSKGDLNCAGSPASRTLFPEVEQPVNNGAGTQTAGSVTSNKQEQERIERERKEADDKRRAEEELAAQQAKLAEERRRFEEEQAQANKKGGFMNGIGKKVKTWLTKIVSEGEDEK